MPRNAKGKSTLEGLQGQLNLFEIQAEQKKKEEYFRSKTEMYNKWLVLPDKILVKDGASERSTLSADLWRGYCKLYSKALHECRNMPDDMEIWVNPCEPENYWIIHSKHEISGEKVDICPYCGAELSKGKGDAYLYKAPAKYWLFYLHFDIPMHNLGYHPKEDREAIRKVWG